MRNIQANLELILISLIFSAITLSSFMFIIFLESKVIGFSGWLPAVAFIFILTVIVLCHIYTIKIYSIRFFNHIDNSKSLRDTMNLNWHESVRVKKYLPILSCYMFSVLPILFLTDGINKFGEEEIDLFFTFFPIYWIVFYASSRGRLNYLYTPEYMKPDYIKSLMKSKQKGLRKFK